VLQILTRRLRIILNVFIILLIGPDLWSLSQAQLNNTRAQKEFIVAHDKVGLSTQSYLINIERSKTLQQHRNYSVIHSLSYRGPESGEK